ncbi:MAG: glycosyltransferase [Oscillospiraceae bacterium]
MKIAVLTMFNGLSNTYSLVNVVEEQLKMLLCHGMEIKVLVSEHCPDSERRGVFCDERLEWVKVINSKGGEMFHWRTYTGAQDKIHDSFFEEAESIATDFVKHLQDVDVCIMHDILYQGVHLVHNVAVRKAQKQLPNVRFLAFTHSAPANHIEAPYPINCMFTPMANTTYIYPTECGIKGLASQYSVEESRCAAVNNSIDPLLGMGQETRKIIHGSQTLQKDIIIVYPARLTMSKRFHIVAELGGFIKTLCKKSVEVIFCDFPCADIDSDMYKFMVKSIGIKSGLAQEDIIFTSDVGFKDGVKRETVFELFTLGNLFICPSYSESFGLTVIEAASRGNYLVLNEAVPPLEELGNKLGAYFMRWGAKNFGFDTQERYLPSEEEYYIENVKKIVANMEENPVIRGKTLARQEYSNKRVYEAQLKPLL